MGDTCSTDANAYGTISGSRKPLQNTDKKCNCDESRFSKFTIMDKYPLDLSYHEKERFYQLGLYNPVSNDLQTKLVRFGKKLSLKQLYLLAKKWFFILKLLFLSKQDILIPIIKKGEKNGGKSILIDNLDVFEIKMVKIDNIIKDMPSFNINQFAC